LVIGIGTRFSDFTTSSKWLFRHPGVRFLNVNVSNFDAWKLDGIPLLADAREALTSLDSALADEGWQASWGAQIDSVRAASCKRPSASIRPSGRKRLLSLKSMMPSIASRCTGNFAR
jgi:3D-(3,5/4)-trihydroxycyclohexane-1,2-dione acylhydrolase (decyclizing)